MRISFLFFFAFASFFTSLPVAAAPTPLPLSVGSQWLLRSPADSTEMVFEVVGQSGDGYSLRWQNPWGPPVEFRFLPNGDTVVLTAMEAGGKALDIPINTVFFDFGARAGQTWSNAVGTFKLVSRTETVATPTGVYRNCMHIRLQTAEGEVFDWLLAPDVGFVQFGAGPGAYVLSSASPPAAIQPLAGAPQPKGSRLLGLEVNTPANNDYLQAVTLARNAGVELVSLTFNWCDMEIAPGIYKSDPDLLAIANQFYPAQKLKVNLHLITMDPAGKCVPRDLQGLTLNHATVINRYKAFVNHVFSRVPNLQINFVSVGSEVDIGLGTNTALWNQYAAFVKAATAHIKLRKPQFQVGFSATLPALVGPLRDRLKQMNQSSTVLVSYFPLKDNYDVQDPAQIGPAFDALLSVYPGRTIHIEQTGYPSSPLLASSEARQSEFVRQLFQVWDRHAAAIRSMMFTWQTDLSPMELNGFLSYYKNSDPRFRAMLGTLGLRTYPGASRDKAAFPALKNEAKARGW